jgi:hypothetical protein
MKGRGSSRKERKREGGWENYKGEEKRNHQVSLLL